MNVLLDLNKPDASLGDSAFELMPFPAVILDADLLVRQANAAARAWLKTAAPDEDPNPAFDTVLAGSGRIPDEVLRRILSCCGAEVLDGNSQGHHDEVFAVAPGYSIALFARPLGAGRWLAVLENRHGSGDPAVYTQETARDPLTEIGDRRYIETKLARALTEDDPDQRPAAVVFDIDRFRAINDRLGRLGGDALLRAVVGRLRQATRAMDPIARLDDDTFAVVQLNGHAADKLAVRLVDLLSRPYLIRGAVTTVGVSVGVARAPADGDSAAVLLRHADFARGEAKKAGGQTWRHYGHGMADRARLRQELEADLRQALPLDQLGFVYQPRVDLRTRTVTGFEALARWTHPKRGPVPPSLFIPVAEDIGLIGRVGEWALRTACRDAAAWPDPLRVAINISARQLDDGQHFVAQVLAAVRMSGLPARRLELEITEAALSRRPDETRIVLRDLHEMGVRIAIDNFGIGETSLRHPRTFPFDTIKIDQSITRSLASDGHAGATMRAIAALGSGLGMTVIAEGVETLNQARMAEADNCGEIQGNLISKPVAAAGVATLLARDLSIVLGD